MYTCMNSVPTLFHDHYRYNLHMHIWPPPRATPSRASCRGSSDPPRPPRACVCACLFVRYSHVSLTYIYVYTYIYI